jgi:hypothetical protein
MRPILRLEPSDSFEEGASFVKTNQGIMISVAEEKAVDSYNASFECTLTATHDQAIQLRDWLLEFYPVQKPAISDGDRK